MQIMVKISQMVFELHVKFSVQTDGRKEVSHRGAPLLKTTNSSMLEKLGLKICYVMLEEATLLLQAAALSV